MPDLRYLKLREDSAAQGPSGERIIEAIRIAAAIPAGAAREHSIKALGHLEDRSSA